MKYLILGVNGMAGHMIAQYLIEQGHTVFGFAKKESPICMTICGDAQNKNMIKEALYAENFDCVVNAIGVLNHSVDENLPNGIYLNSVFPHLVSSYLRNTQTKLIHISTDCVFEGTKGDYLEDDIPDAVSLYGRSKALGEVLDYKNLTIRTSIVGPELKNNGIGLFHWFMNQTQPVCGYTNVIWTGVTTLELAKAIAQDAAYPEIGLMHLVNNRKISKFELLQLFNHHFRNNTVSIIPCDTPASDKSLISTRELPHIHLPDYDRMIQDLAEWIDKHQALYAQYTY